MASAEAARAKWINRPILRASFLSTNLRGSKSLTSAANRTGWPVRSNALISAMPLLPASRPVQTSGAVFPTPQISPRPVTTTRRCSIVLLCRFLVLLDVFDGVLHGLDLLSILVRDLDIERLFELHDELDHVEGVGTEVLLKARARGHFRFIHLKLLDDNLFYLFIYCCHVVLLFY